MNAQTVLLQQQNTRMIPQSAAYAWTFQFTRQAVRARNLMQDYEPVSLEEMDRVALMQRVDTKYVLHVEQLFDALSGLQDQYRVLEVLGKRVSKYHNLYFDTPVFKLYLQHHNESSKRYKIRSRQYVDSDTAFLEVKCKNNREITIKNRLQTCEMVRDFSSGQQAFLAEYFPYDSQQLFPVLVNDFMRITLVSKQKIERLTLDINLQLSSGKQEINLPQLAVAEVKQEQISLDSAFMQQMRMMNIKPQRFSKYCLGITQLYPALKQNRFKPRNLMIERIMRQGKNYGTIG